MTLSHKVFRSLGRRISFNLVTVILTAITVTMLIGALTTADTLMYKSADIFENLKVEDAQFSPTIYIDADAEKAFEDRYNLILEPQYEVDITENDKTIRVERDNSEVNLTWIYEKKDGVFEDTQPSHPGDNEVYICKKYAEANSLKIGDTLSIGNAECKVAGYAVRPDYINTLKEFSESIGDYDNFTIAVINPETFKKAFGDISPAYYSVIYNDDSMINAFRGELYRMFKPIEYFNSDANSRISMIRGEIPMVRDEFSAYSIILFVLVVVLVAFMLSRIIGSESRNIGTLKALGYRKSELILHYVLYALIPTAAGGLIGIIGSVPFSKAFSAFFFGDFDAFPYVVKNNPIYMLAAVLIPIVLNVLVVMMVTSRLLRKDAVILMKKDRGVKKTSHAFGKSNLKFRTLYMLRVLLGNPVRTLVFVAGMISACLIILLGGMCQDSQRNVIDHVLPDLMGDARYETGLKDFHTGNVKNGQTLIDVMFEVPGKTAAFNLVGYDEDNTLLKRETLSGDPVIYGKYYMTSCAANYYGIKPGDEFTFIHRITGVETTVTVTDILDNDGLRLLITSKENAARLVGISADEYNNILSEVPVDVPEEDIYKIADFDTYKESFEQMLSATQIVYRILLIVGIIVCILIVNLLSGMVIDENSRNISMLKVFGYKDKEIQNIILRMNHLLVPVCYILSIPLTAYMTKLMMTNAVENSGVWIDVIVKPSTLIIYFLIVICSYFASLFLAKRKIDRVDMAVSLKQED